MDYKTFEPIYSFPERVIGRLSKQDRPVEGPEKKWAPFLQDVPESVFVHVSGYFRFCCSAPPHILNRPLWCSQ